MGELMEFAFKFARKEYAPWSSKMCAPEFWKQAPREKQIRGFCDFWTATEFSSLVVLTVLDEENFSSKFRSIEWTIACPLGGRSLDALFWQIFSQHNCSRMFLVKHHCCKTPRRAVGHALSAGIRGHVHVTKLCTFAVHCTSQYVIALVFYRRGQMTGEKRAVQEYEIMRGVCSFCRLELGEEYELGCKAGKASSRKQCALAHLTFVESLMERNGWK